MANGHNRVLPHNTHRIAIHPLKSHKHQHKEKDNEPFHQRTSVE